MGEWEPWALLWLCSPWAFGAVTSIGLHFFVHLIRGLDWMTASICSGSVISVVCNSWNRNIRWLLEKLYEFLYCLSQQQWLDFVPIQNPFRTACVSSFPFDYTGFFSVNKNSFLKLSFPCCLIHSLMLQSTAWDMTFPFILVKLWCHKIWIDASSWIKQLRINYKWECSYLYTYVSR